MTFYSDFCNDLRRIGVNHTIRWSAALILLKIGDIPHRVGAQPSMAVTCIYSAGNVLKPSSESPAGSRFTMLRPAKGDLRGLDLYATFRTLGASRGPTSAASSACWIERVWMISMSLGHPSPGRIARGMMAVLNPSLAASRSRVGI